MVLEKYRGIVTDALAKMREHAITAQLQNELGETGKALADYRIVVPIIGSFSAGKTSIINTLLGEDILSVDVTPETAIATELHYADTPRIELVRQGGEVVTLPLEGLGRMPTKDFLFQRIHLTNKALADLPSIVLVDMPGLGSGVEIHNKAILNYIKEGSTYIIVVDVEEGTLRQSNLDYIKEVLSYDLSVAILINKIDKKMPKAVDEVVANIAAVARTQFGKDIFVGRTSAHEANLTDFRTILAKLTVDEFVRRKFQGGLSSLFERARGELQVRINSMVLSTDDLDRQLAEIQKQQEAITSKADKEKRSLDRKFSEDGAEEILDEIKRALLAESPRLAGLLMDRNERGFSFQVNEIIRPIMINKTKKLVEVEVSSYIKDINAILEASTREGGKADGPIDDLMKNLSPLLASSSGGKDKAQIDSILGKIGGKEMTGIYKTLVGVLGIITTLVDPWLAVVLFFIPDILKLFSPAGGGSEAKEKQALEKVKSKIEYEIIPQIASGLRPKIQDSLEELKASIMDELTKTTQGEFTRIQDVIEKLKQEKGKKAAELEAGRSACLSYIEYWSNLKKQLD